MLLYALILAAQAKPAIPPPPPIVVAPPVPYLRDSGVATPIAVRVIVGDQVLLSDTLRVDGLSGGNYNQSRVEAGPDNCPSEFRSYTGTNTGLNLRLNRRGTDQQGYFAISLSWSRAADPSTCASYGTRTATLNHNFELKPGQTLRLTGDAGLVVELRRK